MLQVFLLAVPLGITLSFAAGPVFFVVVETSISQGKTKAMMLDLGAVIADSIFILIAFYGSQTLINSLRNNVWVTTISGLAVIAFGGYYILKSHHTGQFQRNMELSRKRHFFIKGFLLNFLNIGVLFFWIATTVSIGNLLDNDPEKMLWFYAATVGSYIIIDLFKIYFANLFKEKLRGRKIQVVEKLIGYVLVVFGIALVVKNIFW